MANERMINRVSAGIVFVAGPGDYAISAAERAHVIAEVQTGLDALAGNEPRARLSWVISSRVATLQNFTAWQGANWPGLTEPFYRGISDALWSGTTQKIYFFNGSEYIRVDPNNGWNADPGYPKPIAGNWPGFPASFAAGIDAALWSETNQRVYFFKGSQYLRVDPNAGWAVEPGYPKAIAGNWPGFPAEFAAGVDAALWSGTNQRIYFFKGDKYIRVDPNNGFNVEPGYPLPIAGNWPGFPDEFAKGVDGALWSGTTNKIYFFKRNRFYNDYIRVDPNNGWNVEPGYPKPVGLGWEAEDKWRDPALALLGFPAGQAGYDQLSQALQTASGSQFGYIGFFTKMPTAWMGYASGLKVVMRTQGSLTAWTSIDRIYAHETGHIFGAPDEYTSSKCACDSVSARWFTEVNGNCKVCAVNPQACLMDNNVNSICTFTHAQIGWKAFLNKLDAGVHTYANNALYQFSGEYYVRYTGFTLDAGYPKKIAGNWPGFPASFQAGVDAALWSGPTNKVYFFKGNQYLRVDPANGWAVEAGYPKPIAGNWPGFPASFAAGVDVALWSPTTQRIYFFKGNQYLRVDPANGWAVEAGYPKPIAGNWPGFPASFAAGIDAASWGEPNQRIYFFSGTRYVRVDPNNGWQVEPGYPQPINRNWMPFPVAPLRFSRTGEFAEKEVEARSADTD
ncbi:hypothetical protein E3T55_04595 [Cryobacterium frigoriphilum]|uniref:Hemopexin n=1 Tax=Cryobacterium frigoriphilum TaxID=1259150 RepID=A0A4R9A807_9MICO|nr:hemopexin repeat-containing protein [Cryobacterium frigoriphilum]TFD53972.1 hypothetical protein E3T55_04595 [Cryobacterium frigoriphilum]